MNRFDGLDDLVRGDGGGVEVEGVWVFVGVEVDEAQVFFFKLIDIILVEI